MQGYEIQLNKEVWLVPVEAVSGEEGYGDYVLNILSIRMDHKTFLFSHECEAMVPDMAHTTLRPSHTHMVSSTPPHGRLHLFTLFSTQSH